MSQRVLVCGRLPDAGRDHFESAGLEVDHQPDRGAGSLVDIIEPYAGVIIHSPHQVDVAALAAGSNLRVVGRAGVGVDNIDVDAATRHGVLVMNLPWGNTVTAAEHTIAMMMALARNIPQASAALRQGTWERGRYLGTEIKDKTLGIVGLGRIGREVARRARGMEMRVLGVDPILSPSVAADLGIELLELNELLPRVDFLTLHVPRTPETVGLIGKEALAAVKPGARIINCARGGLIDEAALLAALESCHVAGAACDVFATEPTDNTDLLAHERFIGTPHLGGATHEARRRVGEGICQQVADFLSSGKIRHAVNVRALPPEDQQKMLPYLALGERLGSFIGQCFSGIDSLEIETLGEINAYTLRPVVSRIVEGLLRTRTDAGERGGDFERVNVVNAMALARDHGLRVEHRRRDGDSGYSSLVRVTAHAESGVHTAAGTVFEHGGGDVADAEPQLRFVQIEDLPIELAPAGHLVVLANDDRPGVIGMLGAFLAERAINIADMRLGRDAEGGQAIAAVTVDQPLSLADRDELASRPGIRWLRAVSFGAAS